MQVSLMMSLMCFGVCAKIQPHTAERALTEHLQLLALADPSGDWQQYLEIVSGQSYADKLEFKDEIYQQINQFWQHKNVVLPFSRFKNHSNLSSQQIALALEPNVSDYLAVKNIIRKLLWLGQQSSWETIAPGGLLRLGDSHRTINAIALRLWLLGDAAKPLELTSVYSSELHLAVVRFQARHGLKTDGVIGPQTLFWLNRTPYKKAQILAQSFVEKTSYLATIEPRYILVNIPAYKMELVDKQRLVLSSRVIVGKSYRQTPVFKGEISNIVINPTWTVPRKLLRRDVLPKIKGDGHYVAEQQFDVFDYQGKVVKKSPLQWQQEATGRFPYRLVQRPGSHNALGRYKIHFQNDLNVYLHDTPTPELFNEPQRALSSGCVRIEAIQELADWFANNLVIDKRTWKRLQSDYETTQWFSLKQTLPVHFVYWSSWVNEQQVAQFRNDIYQKLIPQVQTQIASAQPVSQNALPIGPLPLNPAVEM
ncbi:murein L,D-transpeptidase [Shewanella intestini]|uniref:L,D-transpeptidase family protein n=1 Tax=Shewanella intestini TaxID=2017544 RepID=A0ABS5HYX4_9GAMM|nr:MULTISPECIES: L,D-transpeptidase family protein [Shewanella]MBR9726942.1 L,D-transpeptidase family protein [Shewanella intestini]MRG34492.1 L,D-transpeptidase family protein [Shewanella sp. XMDDZSB0408]